MISKSRVEAVFVATCEIAVNPLYGRHQRRFEDADFAALRRSIAATSKNIAPALIRRTSDGARELVYGGRRLQACEELGLQLFAVEYQALTLAEAFAWMLSDARQNWSLFEIGTSVRLALDGGLFPSQRRLALACGLEQRFIGDSMGFVQLPDSVLSLFPNVTTVSTVFARRLTRALNEDPEALLAKARQCAARMKTARNVVDYLCPRKESRFTHRNFPRK